jgi:hypothetical protein
VSVGEWLLACFFGLWLGLTALCQLPTKTSDRIRTWDLLNIIPRWNFFAPRPSTQDFHLLFRDRLVDGTVSPWREVPPARPPKLINPIWNPGRRYNKALFDATQHLAQEVKRYRHNLPGLRISIPYLAILNFVSNLEHSSDATELQFLIMASKGRAALSEPEIVFVSSLHALKDVEG